MSVFDIDDDLSDHEPFVENRFGDRYLYSVNRDGFEVLGANAVFEQSFSDKLFNEDTLYIIIGTDSGLLLRYLDGAGLPKGTRYIFVELPHIIDRLEAISDFEKLDERICLVPPDEWEKTSEAFQINNYIFLDGVKVERSVGCLDKYIFDYEEVASEIESRVSLISWEASASLGTQSFIRRQIQNLTENISSVAALKNKFEGETAVLLAGGPSLDHVIPWLKDNRKKVVVFSVSRISRRLLQVEVTPDFVVTVDPHDLSYDVSKEMLEFGGSTILINSHHASPLLVGQWSNPSFYFGPRLPWDSSFNEETIDPPGPTVTNTALALIHELGFNQIILGGVDLCMSPDGYSHAQGSNEYAAGPRLQEAGQKVQTNGGRTALTTEDFATARDVLERQAEIISEKGCRIINPSKDSAKIQYVDFIPLDNICLREQGVDAYKRVVGKLSGLFGEGKREHLFAARSDINSLILKINEIVSLCKEALRLNDRLFKNDHVLHQEAKGRMDEIEFLLDKDFKDVAYLTKLFAIRDFLKMTRPFLAGKAEDLTHDEIIELGATYYRSYIDGARELIDLCEEALERIEARLEEEKEDADVDRLFQQWDRDRQFRRSLFWKSTHLKSYERLDDKLKERFNDFASRYLEGVRSKENAHIRRSRAYSDLKFSRARANKYFFRNEKDLLEDLVKLLSRHPKQEECAPYFNLAKGYLYEMNGEYDKALESFYPIVDMGFKDALEDALRHIANISLKINNVDNSESAFLCLSQLSPVYQPFYAEIKRIKGDVLGAIDVYNDYLAKFPDDTYVKLKLARLYIDMGVYDGAGILVDHILKDNPENEAAKNISSFLVNVG